MNPFNVMLFIDYNRESDWTWILTVCFALITLSGLLWIIISLLHYGIKKRKFRLIQRNNKEELRNGLIFVCPVLCTVLCIIVNSLALVLVNIEPSPLSNRYCEIVSDVSKVVYSSVIFIVYLFLWLRQRAFYSNALLNIQYRKAITYYSFLSIFLIFAGGLAVVVVSVAPVDALFYQTGCVYLHVEDFSGSVSLSIGILMAIFGQISLLSLVFYALVKPDHSDQSLFKYFFQKYLKCSQSRKNVKSEDDNCSANLPHVNARVLDKNKTDKTSQNRKSLASIKSILKITFIFAFLSTLVQITLLIIIYELSNSYRNLWAMGSCIAAPIQCIFLILSFLERKEMLSSPCLCKKEILRDPTCRT